MKGGIDGEREGWWNRGRVVGSNRGMGGGKEGGMKGGMEGQTD